MTRQIVRIARPALRAGLLLMAFHLIARPSGAQTPQSFNACYVPSVGAIYLVGLTGLPSGCLGSSHVAIALGVGALADGSVTAVKLADGAVIAVKIADGAVTPAKLAFDPATQAELDAQAAALASPGTVNGSTNPVDWTKLKGMPPAFADGVDNEGGAPADGSITTAKLADGAVTPAKLTFDPATQGELDGQGTALASPGTVNSASNPVDWTKLKGVPGAFADGVDNEGGVPADGAITTAKLADGAVIGVKITDGAVTPAKLAFDPVTQAELDAQAAALASPGTVNSAANPVDWTKVKGVPGGFADGVDNEGGAVADGSITTAKLADGAVIGPKVAAGAIGNGQLADNAVNSAKIIDSSVGTADIATGAVTNDKLSTITAAGKIANSATTATPHTVGNTIVARDASGNFTASALSLNSYLLSIGTVDQGLPQFGPGTRFMWWPARAAFRSGSVEGSQWDFAVIGVNSVAMGRNTTASGLNSTAMGSHTTASGENATAMGFETIATGNHSIALGYRAHATHEGSFVFADAVSSAPIMNTNAPNRFGVRATGGATFISNASHTTGVTLAPGANSWGVYSDRNRKEFFRSVDGEAVLQKVMALWIPSWSYIGADPGRRYVGPMAQDFQAAFGLGTDTTITTHDMDGVTLAAVQALGKRTEQLRQENAALRARLGDLERQLARIEAMLKP